MTFLFFLILIGDSFAATVDVNNDGDFDDVSAAISQAGSGGTVYLNNHSFKGLGSQISISRTFNGITIDGSINPNNGGLGSEKSTLDANGLSRIFSISGSNIVLKNIILTNGFLSGNNNEGAGFHNTGNNLKLVNCEITHCTASGTNAHSAFYSGSQYPITFDNCIIANNTATSSHGNIVRTGYYKGIMNNTLVADNTVTTSNPQAVGISCYDGDTNTVANSIFRNNKITSSSSSAICLGAGTQLFGIMYNTTFINNSISGGDSHAGALCFRPGSTIYNCTFIANSAYRGGATTFHASGVLDNCIFINNTATAMGGAITTGYDGSSSQEVFITDCYFEGNSAPIGGAFASKGNNINIYNSTFLNNSATNKGGGLYIIDSGVTLINSSFNSNTANEGGGMYVNGDNVEVKSSTFENNTATIGGALFVKGNDVSVVGSNFTGNKVNNGSNYGLGGAVAIVGSNINFDNSEFISNSALGDGGAVYVNGNNIKLNNSDFYNNSAISHEGNLNQGCGGAIYTTGSGDYSNSNFNYNTAINGSAIYVLKGTTTLDNITFYKNQAHAYLLPIIVYNPKNKYNTTVNITTVLICGNNIANAIYNKGNVNDIYFYNVTYGFYIDGKLVEKTTNNNEVHPVEGVENSQGGTLLYQDDRENSQLIKTVVIYNKNGNIVLNESNLTNIWGNTTYSLSGLEPGFYTVNSTHFEDLFYKYITNQTIFEVVNLVDLKINITTNTSLVKLGDIVEWTINLTNLGPFDDINVNVTAIIDNNKQHYIDCIPSKGSYDSVTGIWNVGDLAKGEVVTLIIRTKPVVTGNITFSVIANNGTPDSNLSNNYANATITVMDFNISKTVNVTSPNFGDKVSYSVTVTNDGSSVADGVVVVDRLGDGLVFVSASDNGVYNSTSRMITWTVNLGAGESKSFSVVAIVSGYGNLTNTVVVGNKTACVNVTVPEVVPVKTVNSTSPNFGDKVSYSVTVTNDGSSVADGVVVVDRLGDGLVFVSASDNGVYNSTSRMITWTVNLNSGESKTFNVVAIVSGYGNLTNTVIVGNKSASVNVTVPEIIPVKTVNNTNPYVGDNVTYTIAVTNDGKVNATNVFVKDILPEGLIFISASSNGTYNSTSRMITWTVNIEANSTLNLVVNVNVNVNESGNITNTVIVGNKTVNCTVNSTALADLEINVVADKHIVHIGDTIIWTVTVKNSGPSESVNVVATDILPDSLELISYNVSKGKYDVATGKWNIGDLENNEEVVIIFVTKSLGTGKITNNANVSGDTFDPNMENNFDSDTVEVISEDRPVNPNGGNNSKMHNVEATIKMESTGNPLLIIFLCILTILLVGFRRK